MDATMFLEPETLKYWNLIKDASFKVKDTLISLLWKSMFDEQTISATKPLTDEQRLKEIAEIRKRREKELWAKMPVIKPEDIKISPWVENIVKDVPKIPEDTDYDKVKLDYLMEKYG